MVTTVPHQNQNSVTSTDVTVADAASLWGVSPASVVRARRIAGKGGLVMSRAKTGALSLSQSEKEDLAVTLNVTSKNTPLYVRALGAARMVKAAPHGEKMGQIRHLANIWQVSERLVERAGRVDDGHPLVVAEVEAERLTMAAVLFHNPWLWKRPRMPVISFFIR